MAENTNPAQFLELNRQMEMAAPADRVWELASDFGGIGQWVAVIATVKIVKGGNNAPGTARHIVIQGGGAIDEELLAWDASQRHYRYRIIESVLPVSEYTADFRVDASGADRCTVTWSGRFKRKDTGPNPGARADDAAARKAIAGVYDGGLAGLKQLAENG